MGFWEHYDVTTRLNTPWRTPCCWWVPKPVVCKPQRSKMSCRLQSCHCANVLNKSRVSQHAVYAMYMRGMGHAPSMFATINVRNVRNAGLNVCVFAKVCVWLSVCQHIALTSLPPPPHPLPWSHKGIKNKPTLSSGDEGRQRNVRESIFFSLTTPANILSTMHMHVHVFVVVIEKKSDICIY